MSARMMKYNPAFLTDEELIEGFAVREAELASILEVVRENEGESNQHLLWVGPRGIGKTTLLLRAVAEIRRGQELGDKWYPLVYGEESYQVGSAGEFWLEGLFHVAEQTKEERWRRTYQDLKKERDDQRLRDRALGQLMDFADEQGKRLLFVVENLNMLFGDQMKDNEGWILRHTLLNEKRVMLMGSALRRATLTGPFKEIECMGKPMFDLFMVHELRPLNTKECKRLWKKITGEEAARGRIRPIEILTGGNPRLLAIIINFAVNTSFQKLMEDLTVLVDEHTDYLKGHLERLAAQERKVFTALADIWDPATAREVAEDTRMDVSKTSSFLNRLVERGAVVVVENKKRTKKYQLAERLYNIYHLMRRRGAVTSRVEVVVKFMVMFYEKPELFNTMRMIIDESCNLDKENRKDHFQIIDILLEKLSPEIKAEFIETLPDEYREMSDLPPKLFTLIAEKKVINIVNWMYEIFVEALLKLQTVEYEEVKIFISDMIEKRPEKTIYKSFYGLFLHVCQKKYDEAEIIYRETIENEKHFKFIPMIFLIVLLLESRKQKEALNVIDEYFRETNRSFEGLTELAWNIFVFKIEDYYDQAEAWAREAVEKRPRAPKLKLFLILGRQNKWSEALELAGEFLADKELVEKEMDRIKEFFVEAAAGGYGVEALAVLRGSAGAALLEPLVVGMQMDVGEEVLVAQEIMEIGKDVAGRIGERRESKGEGGRGKG